MFVDFQYTPGQQTRTFIEAVEQYAQLGLRTLCLAWRELGEDEYQEWSLMFKEASSTLVDREVKWTLCKRKKTLMYSHLMSMSCQFIHPLIFTTLCSGD